MSKRAATLFASLALVLFARTSHASSIDTCNFTSTIHCDFNENGATTGIINPLTDGVGFAPGWDAGYTFLLEQGVVYGGGSTGISDVVVFHPNYAELFSEADPNFGTMVSAAQSLSNINGGGCPVLGCAPAFGQIVGDVTGSGALQFNGVGLVHEDALGVAQLVAIIPFADSITITSAPDEAAGGGPTVPEPATLSLLAMGLVGTGIRRWRSRRNGQQR